jgi:conjugal transfer pilus assembly protein TraW
MRFTKYFLMHLRQSKLFTMTPILFLLSGILCCPGQAHAEENWLKRSQQILNSLEGQPRSTWLDGKPYQDGDKQQLMDIGNAGKLIALGEQTSPVKSAINGKPLRLMFISFSLGESVLKGIFQEASGQDDILLVLRGPMPNQKLPGLFADLKKLLKNIEPVPNVIIDPTRFRKYAVTAVPEILVEDQGKAILRVKGVTSLDWLKSRQILGRQGDLGRFGEVYEIAEIDMLAEIRTRLSSINWRQKQSQALASFWEHRRFEMLSAAQENSDRIIDLTVTAPRDVVGPNGKLIIHAGQTANPLDKMSFGLCLLVFDATEKTQVDMVRGLSCQDRKARVMYLATQLPRQDGWDALKTLETSLNAPVYLLTPDVRQRFQLQNVPALVEQTGNRIVVRERKVADPVSGAAS